MKPLKEPGPDGFHLIFFQKEGHVVVPDIYETIRGWFLMGTSIPILVKP